MRLGSFLFASFLLGCASTSPKAAFDESRELVRRRTGQDPHWSRDENSEAAARNETSRLLARDLTLDHAIRVSLLSSPKIQAIYEDLGIAQAELVQAGLLKNPTISATYDAPLDSRGGPAFQLGFVTELLQLITLGPRKHIARLGLEGVKYRVAGEVLHHVYEVKVAFYSAQAAQQTFAMQQIVAASAEASVEMSRRRHQAGTINDLDLANEEAVYAQVTNDLVRSQTELASSRERLNRLMGVWGNETHWKISEKLPELPATDPPIEHIESKAISQRYDLLAAQRDVEIVSYGLALAKNTRWAGGIEAGIDFHRETEGVRLFGPTVSVELPIFDQRQAAIARTEAQLRQVKRREIALAINIRSEVRELAARLAIAKSVVQTYQRTLVPQREKIVALSQQQYDTMLLGVFQLLTAKQNEITTYREFIEALRSYWTTYSELEWAIGGQLVSIPSATSAQSTPQHGEKHEHHAP